MKIDRRSFLASGVVGASLAACTTLPLQPGGEPLVDDLQRRSFDYFWDLGRADTGLVPDRWPSPSFCSIAAVGFALTAYPIAVEHGWITRVQARDRTLATLRFFDTAKQGPEATGVSGYKGFFYHFLHMESGARYRQTELSSVDSTLLFLGMMFAAEWFDGDHPDEVEIRRLGHDIPERADWPWMQRGQRDISMGWHPESGFIKASWIGYNEGMMTVLLALGSGRHPVADGAWDSWLQKIDTCWRGEGETRHLAFAPLFGHQYSHVWIDFRGIRDRVMRAAGFDYFENSSRATYANRAYCIANPMGWDGYSRDIWGLTACDGPGYFKIEQGGETRQIHGYAARGPLGQPDQMDDGTIAPTAAAASIAFAPEIAIPAITAMRRKYGDHLYRRYGFADSFNASITDPSQKLETGSIVPGLGWIATDYLGIDQGPIVTMIANHKNDFVWRTMRRSQTIRRGLQRAGFTGGWLGQ